MTPKPISVPSGFAIVMAEAINETAQTYQDPSVIPRES